MPRQSTKISVTCERCGKIRILKPSKANGRKFCSVACWRATIISPEVRFFEYIGHKDANGCIPWIGFTNKNGYGVIGSGRRGEPNILAHRLSYAIAHGAFDASLHVLHKCDNPPCVNPTHLFLGTDADNHADMVAKNRHAHGESHYACKISDEGVAEIRRRRSSGERLQSIADDFGIHFTTVIHIAKMRSRC